MSKVVNETAPECPSCKKAMAICVGTENRDPKDGDYSICVYCSAIIRFSDPPYRLRELTPEEFVNLPLEERTALKNLQKLVEALHKKASLEQIEEFAALRVVMEDLAQGILNTVAEELPEYGLAIILRAKGSGAIGSRAVCKTNMSERDLLHSVKHITFEFLPEEVKSKIMKERLSE